MKVNNVTYTSNKIDFQTAHISPSSLLGDFVEISQNIDEVCHVASKQEMSSLCRNLLRDDIKAIMHDAASSIPNSHCKTYQNWAKVVKDQELEQALHYLRCMLRVIEEFKSYYGNISALSGLHVKFISAFLNMPKLKEIHVFINGDNAEVWFVLSGKTYADHAAYIENAHVFFENNYESNIEYLVLDEEQLIKDDMPESACSFYK